MKCHELGGVRIKCKKISVIILLLLFSLLMIGAVSAASDANATAISSDVSDTHTTHTDTNTQVDKTNSNNNNEDNIITENKEPLKLKSTNNNNNTNNLKKTKQTKTNSNILTKTDTDTNKLKETNVDSLNGLKYAINDNEEYIILTNDIIGSGIYIETGKIVTINGDGHSIDANERNRIFNVKEGATLILENLKLINGKSSTNGGAIENKGTLNVTNCTFNSNTADYGGGGAIDNQGTLTVTNTTFNRNTANNGVGGAIDNQGTLTVTNTTFTSNTASIGGAIFSSGGVGIGNGVVSFLTTELFDIGVFHAVGVDLVKIQLSTGDGYNGEVWVNVTNSTFNQIVKVNVDNGKGEGTINLPNGNIYTASINVIKDYQVTTQTKEFNTIYDTTSFAALNDEIKKATDNSITLNHNYTYNEFWDTELKNGIPINTKITINGNGHTINATQKGRIFNIASIGNLTLINCTLTGGQITLTGTDAYEPEAGYGGAIYNTGNLILINCTLTNNQITLTGTFVGGGGGAIYNNCNLTIIKTTLTQNKIIMNNNEDFGSGGAILNFYGKVTIKDSNITQNQIGEDPELQGTRGSGGAICNNIGIVIIDNSQLNNNKIYAYDGTGGAIDIGSTGQVDDIVTISNSNITGNKITTYNAGHEYGNAIYYLNHCTLTISNTLLRNGNNNIYHVMDDMGIVDGVVSFLTTQSFSIDVLPVFEGEDVVINLTGGASGFEGEVCVNVTNATFNQIVKVNVKNGEGIGTIKLPIGKYNATINIINDNDELDKISKEFMVMGETSFSALYNNITNSQTGQLTLTHNYTYDNRTDTNLESGINITKTFTIYGNGYTIDGNNTARMFRVIDNGDLTIINITLTHGKGHDEKIGIWNYNVGGAIYGNNTKLKIINSTITNNNATNYGGAIYAGSCNINITDSNITHNNANGNAAYGGAIYNEYGTLTISNSNITNNTSTQEGGAIEVGFSDVIITDSQLTQNTAKGHEAYGGAINAGSCNINITDSNITQNTANGNDAYGGAIYVGFSDVIITGSNITQNTANGGYAYGGAIHIRANCNINITDSQLTQNTANGGYAYGGAIHIYAYGYNSNVNVTGSLFNKNTATSGSSICIEDMNDLRVNYSIFLNNTGSTEFYNRTALTNYEINYNWFGNTLDNHTSKPDVGLDLDNWLFLNATSTPVTVSSTSNITFKLSLYNSTKKLDNVSDIDNGLLYPVNLTINKPTRGSVNIDHAKLGEKIEYTAPDTICSDSVTAHIEGVSCTLNLDIIPEEVDTTITNIVIESLFKDKESLINGTLNAKNMGLPNQDIIINITTNNGFKTFYGRTNNNGNFSIPITPFTSGKINITIIYNGNNTNDNIKYHPTNHTETNVNVEEVQYNITFDPLETSYDYNTTVTITGTVTTNYKTLDVTNVTISLNKGEGKTVELNDGRFTYTFKGIIGGLNNITVTCKEDTNTTQVRIKYPTKFTITVTNSTTDEAIIVTVTEANKFSGIVNLTMNNILVGTVTLHDGSGSNNTIIIPESGLHQLKITYPGNSIYNATNATSNNFLILNKTSFAYLNQQIQNATRDNVNNLTLTNDYKYDPNTDQGLKDGIPINNEFTIYGDNHTINGTQEARIFHVNKNGNLTLDNITLCNGVGQDEIINGEVVNVGGAIYAENNLTITNSILQDNTANKGSGIYIINGTLTTINTKLINNDVDGENYQVKHKDSQLKIETIPDITEGTNLTIKITADPLFNDNVTLNINGNNYTVKIINGKGQISIPNLKPGTYTAKLIFKGNENYTEINVTSNSFKVNSKPVDPTPAPVGKQNTKILAKNKVYKPAKYRTYTITVKNSKGKLVKNTRVKLRIGKKTYTSKTNSKGVATFKIPNKKSKKTKKSTKKSYKITATLNKNAKKDKLTLKMGTKTYNTKTNNNGKGTFKIKTTKKIRKYVVTLKTTSGQVVKKQKVTLKVNKKTYKATTNSKGKATFKINNLNKKGKYKAKITYKGNNNYNKSNKTVKITIKE